MEEVIKVFKQIQETNSIKEKQQIIEKNKHNNLFKGCLIFLLNKNIITGISEKKLKKKIPIENQLCCKINNFSDLIYYILYHNTGRNEDIFIIQNFIKEQPKSHKEFYEQMITKKYRLGVDKKLVNEVIPNLISTFSVQLGTSIEKVKLNGNEWISLSRKMNGCRAAFIGNKIMTRQGKEYKGIEHIINDLLFMGYQDMFIDGELIYKNKEGLSDSEAFQKGTGIAMSKDEDKFQLKFVVFDILPLSEFWNSKSESIYSKRSELLDLLKKKINEYGTENIEVVLRLYKGYDHSQIWKYLKYAEEHDWEGIMINLDTPYEYKRTKNLIKVKQFKECDIKCIGVEEGTGRNKGKLGSIVCDYKGYHVNVPGFSDKDKEYYWKYPEKIVGRIITIKYKEETRNKQGGLSIQFPSFQCIRFDKTEPSYN